MKAGGSSMSQAQAQSPRRRQPNWRSASNGVNCQSRAPHSTLLAAYTNWLKSSEMRPLRCASKAWKVRAAPCGVHGWGPAGVTNGGWRMASAGEAAAVSVAGPRQLASNTWMQAGQTWHAAGPLKKNGLTWRKVHIAMNSAKHSVLVLRTIAAGTRCCRQLPKESTILGRHSRTAAAAAAAGQQGSGACSQTARKWRRQQSVSLRQRLTQQNAQPTCHHAAAAAHLSGSKLRNSASNAGGSRR